MKIVPPNSAKTKSLGLGQSKKRAPITTNSFSKMIEDTGDEPIIETIFSEPDHVLSNISVLADELDRIGQELIEKPLPETFFRYKKHIRLLLKGVARNMEMQSTIGRRGLTGTKEFRTAQAIDEVLAELAEKILRDEKNRIDIMALTDQLKGLIIDLIT